MAGSLGRLVRNILPGGGQVGRISAPEIGLAAQLHLRLIIMLSLITVVRQSERERKRGKESERERDGERE